MIATLVLFVCLASAPDVCHTVHVHYVRVDTGEALTLSECSGVAGMVLARRWLEDHPGHVLRGWRCEPVGSERHDA